MFLYAKATVPSCLVEEHWRAPVLYGLIRLALILWGSISCQLGVIYGIGRCRPADVRLIGYPSNVPRGN